MTDPVKLDGKLKEQVDTEQKSKLLWSSRWGYEYQWLSKWNNYSKKETIPYSIRKNLSKNPWMTSIDAKVEPTPKYPESSSGYVGLRAQFPLENPKDMYTSPRHTIDPPDLPTPPNYSIYLG